jgi:glutamine amidotransferase
MARKRTPGKIVVTGDLIPVAKADIVLPGDGAFPHCRNSLFEHRWRGLGQAVEQRGVPFMDLCRDADAGQRSGTNRCGVFRSPVKASAITPADPLKITPYGLERSGH